MERPPLRRPLPRRPREHRTSAAPVSVSSASSAHQRTPPEATTPFALPAPQAMNWVLLLSFAYVVDTGVLSRRILSLMSEIAGTIGVPQMLPLANTLAHFVHTRSIRLCNRPSRHSHA